MLTIVAMKPATMANAGRLLAVVLPEWCGTIA